MKYCCQDDGVYGIPTYMYDETIKQELSHFITLEVTHTHTKMQKTLHKGNRRLELFNLIVREISV